MPQLTNAAVAVSPSQLTLSYEVDGSLPDSGHWQLSTTFVPGPEGSVDQLGFKMVDGRLTGVFAFDHSDGTGQRHYQATPQRVGSRWTVSFPRDAVRAGSGHWRADLDVDGQDSGFVSGEF